MPDRPPWQLIVTGPARRDVRRLDPPVRRRILAALDAVVANPGSGQLRRLAGRPELRLRVGDWRVLLELDNAKREIIIYRVLPRGRAYD